MCAAVALLGGGCRARQKELEPVKPASPSATAATDTSAPPATTVDREAEARRSDEILAASPPARWATWPMPNFAASGLPNPASYDVSVAGTVLDRITGLMWQRRVGNDKSTFDQAVAKCNDLTLAGYHDWRLPSRIELVSILDTSRTEPSIDLSYFPNTASDWFWSSSPAVDEPSAAWYVYFYFGYPKTDDRRSRFSVRCVRTGSPPAFKGDTDAHYAIGKDSVRDLATALIWQRAASPRLLNYEAAESYCLSLSTDGHKDWRLPSMPELLTLVDERRTSPTIDPQAFPNSPSESFWTSSLFGNKRQQAWHVFFDHGNALYGLLKGTYRVRCVRETS
jgi:hypothetical protein